MLATKHVTTQNPQPQPQPWPQSHPLPKQPVNMPHHSPQSSISSNSIFDTASMQSSQTSIDTPHAVMRDTCSDSIRTPRSSSLVHQATQNQFDQYEWKVWLCLAYNRPLLTTPTVVLIWADSYRGLSSSTCGSRLQWGFMQWPPSPRYAWAMPLSKDWLLELHAWWCITHGVLMATRSTILMLSSKANVYVSHYNVAHENRDSIQPQPQSQSTDHKKCSCYEGEQGFAADCIIKLSHAITSYKQKYIGIEC